MMTGGYAYYDPLPDIAKFFRDKNATSRKNAIEMNHLDWVSLGLRTDPKQTYRFINHEANMYWIDLQELEEVSIKTTKLNKAFMTGVKIILVILLISFLTISFFIFLSFIGVIGAGGLIFKSIL
jgi:hypothetical protein